MKYLTAVEHLGKRCNTLAYSRPGAGKTTFGLQHPYPVIVDPGEQGYMTVLEGHPDVPVLEIESIDDIEEVVFDTDDVMTEWKKHHVEWVDYPFQSFIFENLNLVQETILGKPSKVNPDTKEVIRPAEGIMKLPNSRDNRWTPCPMDFNVLSRKTTEVLKGIRNMPYHTLMTVHAGIFTDEESKKGIDVKESEKTKAGFPNMYGQFKWTGGGLADFYMYLERKVVGNKLQFIAHTRPYKKFEGRSKISKKLPSEINWTDKSLFDVLITAVSKALDESKAKGVTT